MPPQEYRTCISLFLAFDFGGLRASPGLLVTLEVLSQESADEAACRIH